MKTTLARLFTAFLLSGISAVLFFACAETASLAKKHPMELDKAPLCSECHTDGRTALNHTLDFSTRHKFYASQQRETCAICHQISFCSDCHANKDKMKPSDKYKESPERTLPHRGDYLTQHKIDGRINPALCFTCHGRQNNERCRTCHR
jgi:hypothetical protein